MLASLLFASGIGAVSYLLCRWLFILWPPLPAIGLWTIAVLSGSYISGGVMIFWLPMVPLALVGTGFLCRSTKYWISADFEVIKYLLALVALLPLHHICLLVGFYSGHIVGWPPGGESDGFLGSDMPYCLMLTAAPTTTSFLLYFWQWSTNALPTRTTDSSRDGLGHTQ
jgi:hypothetical protein